MMFSRGAVLDGRVDGASTAFKRGIEYDASAKTCARARGATLGQKQVLQLRLKAFARASPASVGKRDIQRAETFLLSIPWPQFQSPQKASQPKICVGNSRIQSSHEPLGARPRPQIRVN